MAEKRSAAELQAALDDIEAKSQKAAEIKDRKERKEEFKKIEAEKKAVKREAKEQEIKLRAQMTGTNKEQMASDVGGLVVGETLFRIIQLLLMKAKVKANWAYLAPAGIVGTAMYAIFFPKKNEHWIRGQLRGVGGYWTNVCLHDGISLLVNSSVQKAGTQQQLQQQNADLQAQLQALQQQAQAAAAAAQPQTTGK